MFRNEESQVHNPTPCCLPLEDAGMAITPGEAAALADFIQHDVTPFIASHAPLEASVLALLAGSVGGVFALYAILRRPTRRPSHQQQKETE